MKRTTMIASALIAAGLVLASGTAQAQRGWGFGPGNGSCAALLPNLNTAPPTQPLSNDEIEALKTALEDEYKARATYNKILAQFGPVRPFSNIVQAEGFHADILTQLFNRYNIPVPADTWADKVPAYNTLLEAGQAAIQAEIDNGALYDDIMAKVTNPEVRAVFNALQFATMQHHLPAFQRLVAVQGGQFNRPGMGRGQGWGPGNGFGRGGCRGCCVGGPGAGFGRGAGMGPGRGRGAGMGPGRGAGWGQGYGRGAGWNANRGVAPGACWYNQSVASQPTN